MIKAAIFDLDGTLIDSTDAIVASFMHTFDTLGEPRPPREAVVGGIGHVIQQQFGMLTRQDPERCTRIYREHYGRICREQTTLLPGAAQCLAGLHRAGLRLGYATSKRRDYADLLLEHLGVRHYFASAIGPDDVRHPKPHPEAVLKSLDVLGVRPDEAFFVGDTHFDVNAAAAAEVRCLCVTTGYNTREQLEALAPEAVYDHLDEITAHILDACGRKLNAAPSIG